LDKAEEMNKSMAVQLQQESESSDGKLNESIKDIQTLTQINQALQQKLGKHEEEHLQCGLFMDQVTAELALLAKDNKTLLTANQELNSILLEMETDTALNEERARKALIDLDLARIEIAQLKAAKETADLEIFQLVETLVSKDVDMVLFTNDKDNKFVVAQPAPSADVPKVSTGMVKVADQTVEALIITQEEVAIGIKDSFNPVEQKIPATPVSRTLRNKLNGKRYTIVILGCAPSSLAPIFPPSLRNYLMYLMRVLPRPASALHLRTSLSRSTHCPKTKNANRLFQDQLPPTIRKSPLYCHPLLNIMSKPQTPTCELIQPMILSAKCMARSTVR
jgi:hypothetical protein